MTTETVKTTAYKHVCDLCLESKTTLEEGPPNFWHMKGESLLCPQCNSTVNYVLDALGWEQQPYTEKQKIDILIFAMGHVQGSRSGIDRSQLIEQK